MSHAVILISKPSCHIAACKCGSKCDAGTLSTACLHLTPLPCDAAVRNADRGEGGIFCWRSSLTNSHYANSALFIIALTLKLVCYITVLEFLPLTLNNNMSFMGQIYLIWAIFWFLFFNLTLFHQESHIEITNLSCKCAPAMTGT